MKTRTRKNYDDFVSNNGFEPKFAYCQVTFVDYDASVEVTIKLSCDEDKNDNDIFYYCNGISELLSLFEKGQGNDFYLSGIATFGMDV